MEETAFVSVAIYGCQRPARSSFKILHVTLWIISFFTDHFNRQIFRVVVWSLWTFSDQLFMTSGQKLHIFLSIIQLSESMILLTPPSQSGNVIVLNIDIVLIRTTQSIRLMNLYVNDLICRFSILKFAKKLKHAHYHLMFCRKETV